jgi:type IV pilus assembly protein PilP
MSLVLSLFLFLSFVFAQVSQPNAEEVIPAAPPALPNNNELQVPSSANVMVPATEFVWDPTGKKDPFRPFKAPRILRSDSETQVDPLTLLELSNISVVAVLWNTTKPRAIIQDGGGSRFTIFRNTKIGTNSGFVADIREGEIVVIETFDDGFGNVVKEPKVISMKKNFPLSNQDKLGNLKETGGQNDD